MWTLVKFGLLIIAILLIGTFIYQTRNMYVEYQLICEDHADLTMENDCLRQQLAAATQHRVHLAEPSEAPTFRRPLAVIEEEGEPEEEEEEELLVATDDDAVSDGEMIDDDGVEELEEPPQTSTVIEPQYFLQMFSPFPFTAAMLNNPSSSHAADTEVVIFHQSSDILSLDNDNHDDDKVIVVEEECDVLEEMPMEEEICVVELDDHCSEKEVILTEEPLEEATEPTETVLPVPAATPITTTTTTPAVKGGSTKRKWSINEMRDLATKHRIGTDLDIAKMKKGELHKALSERGLLVDPQ